MAALLDSVRSVLGMAPAQHDMLARMLAVGRDLIAENSSQASAAGTIDNLAQVPPGLCRRSTRPCKAAWRCLALCHGGGRLGAGHAAAAEKLA